MLTVQELGTIALLTTFFDLYKKLSNLGLRTGTMRAYLHGDFDEGEKKVVLSSSFLGMLFTGFLLSFPPMLAVKPVASMLGLDNKYDLCIIILFAINFLSLVNLSRQIYFRINQQSKRFLVWNNVLHVSNLVLSIVFVVGLRLGVLGFVYAQLISMSFIVLMFLPGYVSVVKYGFRLRYFWESLSYGLHFVFAGISSWLLNLSDRWVLSLIRGIQLVGYYSIGYRFGQVFKIIAEGVRNQWGYSLYRMGPKENVAELLIKTFNRYFLFMSILWMGLTLLVRETIALLLPAEYHHVYIVVPVVALGYICYGVADIFSAGLHLERKPKWFWIINILAGISNIGLNILFIPKYGMIAAAYTTLIAFLVQPVCYYIITKKSYRLIFPWVRFTKLVGLMSLVYLVFLFVKIDNLLIAFIFKIFSIIGSFILLCLLRIPYDSDMRLLRDKVRGLVFS